MLNAPDKNELRNVMQTDKSFKSLGRETVEMINMFAGTNIKIDEKEEVVDMCKAWEDMIQDGVKEGERKGKREGLREGLREGRNNMLYLLVQDGDLNIEVAAKKINMTVDEFKSAMEEADYKVPELV